MATFLGLVFLLGHFLAISQAAPEICLSDTSVAGGSTSCHDKVCMPAGEWWKDTGDGPKPDDGYRVEHCPEGWTRYKSEKCLKLFIKAKKTHTDAIRDCQEQGATLASVSDKKEHQFMTSFILQNTGVKGSENVWVGGAQKGVRFLWSDNTLFEYANWATGHPGKDGDNCVYLVTGAELSKTPGNDFRMASQACAESLPYICQKSQADSRRVYFIRSKTSGSGGHDETETLITKKTSTSGDPHDSKTNETSVSSDGEVITKITTIKTIVTGGSDNPDESEVTKTKKTSGSDGDDDLKTGKKKTGSDGADDSTTVTSKKTTKSGDPGDSKTTSTNETSVSGDGDVITKVTTITTTTVISDSDHPDESDVTTTKKTSGADGDDEPKTGTFKKKSGPDGDTEIKTTTTKITSGSDDGTTTTKNTSGSDDAEESKTGTSKKKPGSDGADETKTVTTKETTESEKGKPGGRSLGAGESDEPDPKTKIPKDTTGSGDEDGSTKTKKQPVSGQLEESKTTTTTTTTNTSEDDVDGKATTNKKNSVSDDTDGTKSTTTTTNETSGPTDSDVSTTKTTVTKKTSESDSGDTGDSKTKKPNKGGGKHSTITTITTLLTGESEPDESESEDGSKTKKKPTSEGSKTTTTKTSGTGSDDTDGSNSKTTTTTTKKTSGTGDDTDGANSTTTTTTGKKKPGSDDTDGPSSKTTRTTTTKKTFGSDGGEESEDNDGSSSTRNKKKGGKSTITKITRIFGFGADDDDDPDNLKKSKKGHSKKFKTTKTTREMSESDDPEYSKKGRGRKWFKKTSKEGHKRTLTGFTTVYREGDPGNGIAGYDLKSKEDRVFAFDYDHTGKLDHLVLYRPGSSMISILKNTNGEFTKVYSEKDTPAGKGIGGYDLISTDDHIFAFDYESSGNLDYLACYRSGVGEFHILKHTKGEFIHIYPEKHLAQGIGEYDLKSPDDRAFAFDYDHSGKLDHLVLYRPGAKTIYVIKNNQNGTFSPLYGKVEFGTGIAGYDLARPYDQAFAFDYDNTGKMDHIVIYRPGTGAIVIIKNKDGQFTRVYTQPDPGKGIGGYDLRVPQDKMFPFDYDGVGRMNHLIVYRPGTGGVWILKNTDGNFTPIYAQGEGGNGIGGYDLKRPYDLGFAFDYDHSGKNDYLVWYRPATGTIWIIRNNDHDHETETTETETFDDSGEFDPKSGKKKKGHGGKHSRITKITRILTGYEDGDESDDPQEYKRRNNGSGRFGKSKTTKTTRKTFEGEDPEFSKNGNKHKKWSKATKEEPTPSGRSLKPTLTGFTPIYAQGDPGSGIGGYDLKSTQDRVFAFDYDHSGKSDHLVLYRSGGKMISILKNTNGNFSKVYTEKSSTSGKGIGGYDLISEYDRIFPFDYDSIGKLDHLVCYRPGTGEFHILKNTNGEFTHIYQEKFVAQGIAGFDLKNPIDRAFAFDYDHSGKRDHLVLYRSGAGVIMIIKNNQNGTFSPVYGKAEFGKGIAGWDLANGWDTAFAFDYDNTGKMDHICIYRPGKGAIVFIKNTDGKFSPLYSQPDPGRGVGGFDLKRNFDQIFPFDFDGVGRLNHLVVYRPGTGAVWILKNTNGNFTHIYAESDPGKGIGGYDVKRQNDVGFAFDYDSSGKNDYIVWVRPGTGTIWILRNNDHEHVSETTETETKEDDGGGSETITTITRTTYVTEEEPKK